ncbi:MAG: hypothetical protein DI629_12310 [Mesorhizobium amorphae]|nr:MAG: hypothetical protein DI629_12310 [Mesorhizobium amorphae]
MSWEPEYEDRPASIAALRISMGLAIDAYDRHASDHLLYAGPLAVTNEHTALRARDAERGMAKCSEEIAAFARSLYRLEEAASTDCLHGLLDQRRKSGFSIGATAGRRA